MMSRKTSHFLSNDKCVESKLEHRDAGEIEKLPPVAKLSHIH
jgi:hypothetical protein